MQWTKANRLIIVLLSALMLLLLWATAVAQPQTDSRNITRIGSDLTIAEKQVVKDATAIAGSVTVLKEGHVTGNAAAIGGNVILKTGARVDGDVSVVGGEMLKEEEATIGGDTFTAFSDSKDLVRDIRKWGVGGLLSHLYLWSAAFHLIAMVVVTALGLLLILFIPNFLQTIVATINQTPLKSGAWGLGGAIALMLLGILLGGSLLGMIVLPVVNLVALAAGLLGTTSMGLFLGERTIEPI
jgi:hypothetical protein